MPATDFLDGKESDHMLKFSPMPRRISIQIELTAPQRILLSSMHEGTLSTKFSRRHAVRAEVIVRAAGGETNYMIAKQLGISRNTVKLWRYRFAREGLAGLETRPIPGRPRRIDIPGGHPVVDNALATEAMA